MVGVARVAAGLVRSPKALEWYPAPRLRGSYRGRQAPGCDLPGVNRHRAVVPPVAENRTEAPIETVGASGTSLDSAGAGTGDRAIDITQARVLAWN